jgi:hypothetical protein
VKRMSETALVSAEIGGGFVDMSGLHENKVKRQNERDGTCEHQDQRWIH